MTVDIKPLVNTNATPEGPYAGLIRKMRSLSADFDLLLEDEDRDLPKCVEMNLADISIDLGWMARELEERGN